MPLRLQNRRIDHHPLYVWMLIALLIIAILLPFHLSMVGHAHRALNQDVADMMAVAVGLGALGALVGVVSGTKWFRRKADVRDCFLLESWCLVPAVCAAGVFWIALILTAEDLQVAVLVGGMIIGLVWTSVDLRCQANRLTEDLRRKLTVKAGRS